MFQLHKMLTGQVKIDKQILTFFSIISKFFMYKLILNIKGSRFG